MVPILEQLDDALVVPRVHQLDLEAGGERVAIKEPGQVHLAPLPEPVPELGQGLVLGQEGHRTDRRERRDVRGQGDCLDGEGALGARDVVEVSDDLHLLLHVLDARREPGLDQPEARQEEEHEQHRRRRRERHQAVASQPLQAAGDAERDETEEAEHPQSSRW
jgi:hypothetical protein